MKSEKEIRKPVISNVDIFLQTSTFLGLPTIVGVFIVGMILIASITLFIYFPIFFSIPLDIIFIIVAYVPAYLVHKDDPVGYRTWLAVLFTSESFHSDFCKKRNITIINLENRNIKYSTLTNLYGRNFLNEKK